MYFPAVFFMGVAQIGFVGDTRGGHLLGCGSVILSCFPGNGGIYRVFVPGCVGCGGHKRLARVKRYRGCFVTIPSLSSLVRRVF